MRYALRHYFSSFNCAFTIDLSILECIKSELIAKFEHRHDERTVSIKRTMCGANVSRIDFIIYQIRLALVFKY